VIFTVIKELEPESQYFKHISKDIKGMSESAYNEFVTKQRVFQESRKDLTDARKRFDWAAKQAYIAMTNMMFAAAIKGIDSCPIEGFVPSSIDELLHARGIIDCAAEGVSVMLALGYREAGDNIKNKTRRMLSEVIKYT